MADAVRRESKGINKVYNIILVFTLVVIPAFIMRFVNALIFRAIRSQRRKIIPRIEQSSSISQGEMCNVEKGTENSQKRKGTIACVAVVLLLSCPGFRALFTQTESGCF